MFFSFLRGGEGAAGSIRSAGGQVELVGDDDTNYLCEIKRVKKCELKQRCVQILALACGVGQAPCRPRCSNSKIKHFKNKQMDV